MKKFQITAGILALVSLLMIGIFTLVQDSFADRLDDQSVTERWAADGTRYAQLSAFISPHAGIDENRVRHSLTSSLDSAYTEASIDANENARLYVCAYSGEKSVSVSKINRDTGMIAKSGVTATAMGVGGDFFLFHRLKLLSGGYIDTGDTVLNDTLIIDNDIAWQFFGSPDVVGQSLLINGKTCYISGVCEPDRAYSEFYGDAPRIYMSYSLLNELAELNVTCIEVCMPDPVRDFAADIFKGALSAPEDQLEIVENSARFTDRGLFERLKTFSERSVRTKLVSYPYWENAAVVLADRAAILYVGKLLPITLTVLLAVIELVLAYRRRKRFFGAVGSRLAVWWDKIGQEHRRRVRERSAAKANAQLEAAGTNALSEPKPPLKPLGNDDSVREKNHREGGTD